MVRIEEQLGERSESRLVRDREGTHDRNAVVDRAIRRRRVHRDIQHAAAHAAIEAAPAQKGTGVGGGEADRAPMVGRGVQSAADVAAELRGERERGDLTALHRQAQRHVAQRLAVETRERVDRDVEIEVERRGLRVARREDRKDRVDEATAVAEIAAHRHMGVGGARDHAVAALLDRERHDHRIGRRRRGFARQGDACEQDRARHDTAQPAMARRRMGACGAGIPLDHRHPIWPKEHRHPGLRDRTPRKRQKPGAAGASFGR